MNDWEPVCVGQFLAWFEETGVAPNLPARWENLPARWENLPLFWEMRCAHKKTEHVETCPGCPVGQIVETGVHDRCFHRTLKILSAVAF